MTMDCSCWDSTEHTEKNVICDAHQVPRHVGYIVPTSLSSKNRPEVSYGVPLTISSPSLWLQA